MSQGEWWFTQGQQEEFEARFDKFYAPISKDACWIWRGAKTPKGYGISSVNGKNRYAHRLQYARWHGCPVPPGMVVMHACDNPSCVNPFHLSTGTQAENIRDAKRKGRMASGKNHGLVKNQDAAARGERVASSKLTAQQVEEIRQTYQKGTPNIRSEHSLTGLARKYGVVPQTISKIINRRNWK